MAKIKTSFAKPKMPRLTTPRTPSVRKPKTSVMKQNKPGKMAF